MKDALEHWHESISGRSDDDLWRLGEPMLALLLLIIYPRFSLLQDRAEIISWCLSCSVLLYLISFLSYSANSKMGVHLRWTTTEPALDLHLHGVIDSLMPLLPPTSLRRNSYEP